MTGFPFFSATESRLIVSRYIPTPLVVPAPVNERRNRHKHLIYIVTTQLPGADCGVVKASAIDAPPRANCEAPGNGVSHLLLGVPTTTQFSPEAVAGSRKVCIPAQVQLAFLKEAFAQHYPACFKRFEGGDMEAVDRCWGKGHSR